MAELTKEEKYLFRNEITKREEIIDLMEEWEKTVSDAQNTVSKAKRKMKFMRDGFFPGYFNDGNIRVLFVGWEPYDVEPYDYVLSTIKHFNDYKGVNGVLFWKRIIGMYNIIQKYHKYHGNLEYKNEDKIVQDMKSNGYGFAVIDISKYLNETGKSKCDGDRLNNFFADSKLGEKKFLKKELAILEPQYIITANIWESGIDVKLLGECFGTTGYSGCDVTNSASLNTIVINDKETWLIDCFHFSQKGKCCFDNFYVPLSDFLKGIKSGFYVHKMPE